MIDKVVIAQILTTLVAFFIFLWLAKRLFWSGIIGMIEDRQARIRSEFDRIDSMQRQVDALQADYAKRLADIEAEARQKMQDAIAQGRQQAVELQEQARKESQALQERTEQMLSIEMDKARKELKQDVARMTLVATEKLIRKNMDDSAQREQVNQFVEELSRR